MGSIGGHHSYVPETTTPPAFDPSYLPSGNSEDLTLVQATELERTQCWHISSPKAYLVGTSPSSSQTLASNSMQSMVGSQCQDPISAWLPSIRRYMTIHDSGLNSRPWKTSGRQISNQFVRRQPRRSKTN